MTTRTVTPADYAAALALAPTEHRSSARDSAATKVARYAAGNACPRCGEAFTAVNPAEFAHYVPSAAVCTSSGVWFGSTACRTCNMTDRAALSLLGLTDNDPLPYAYVVQNFTVPVDFDTRAEILTMAANLPDERMARHTDEHVQDAAIAALRACGLG